MSRTLSLIGAPSSAGAYAAGQERAPDAWRRHGVTRSLEAAGRVVRDRNGSPVTRSMWDNRLIRHRTKTACTVEACIPSRPDG